MSSIPSEFRGVTAVAKANVYFDGKVVSHSILFPATISIRSALSVPKWNFPA